MDHIQNWMTEKGCILNPSKIKANNQPRYKTYKLQPNILEHFQPLFNRTFSTTLEPNILEHF